MKESKKVKTTEQKKQEEVENNEIPQTEKDNGDPIVKGEHSDGDIRPFKSSKSIENTN